MSEEEHSGKLLKELRVQRGILKRQVTLLIGKLESEDHSESFLQEQSSRLKSKLSEIEKLDLNVATLFSDQSGDEFQQEIDSQTTYQYDIIQRISQLMEKSRKTGECGISTAQTSILCQQTAKPHEIKLPIFSGELTDAMGFSDFLRMYDDIIGSRPEYSNTVKLIYLKSYLRGNALDVVKYLSNCDLNFSIALDLLKKEYLDENIIIERILRVLTQLDHPAEHDFDSMEAFFRSVRSSIHELRNYGLDAMEAESFGSRLLSFILLQKLPQSFRLRLSLLLETDYPSVEQLMDKSSGVIKSLRKTGSLSAQTSSLRLTSSKKYHLHKQRSVGHSFMKTENTPKSSVKPQTRTSSKVESQYQPLSTVQAFATTTNKPAQKCKMCDGEHSMIQCKTYSTAVKRIQRLRQLGLCTKCSGNHGTDSCPAQCRGLSYPCSLCKSTLHITALCQTNDSSRKDTIQHNLCLLTDNDSAESKSLLPSISAIMFKDDDSPSEIVRCLVDPGSQTSYISQTLADQLEIQVQEFVTLNVRTFIGIRPKTFGKAHCTIHITPQNCVDAHFLVDPDMDLDYEVPGTYDLIQKLKFRKFKFADSFYREISNDLISGFNCLLGADLLHYLEPLYTQPLNHSVTYRVPDGIILFGKPNQLIQESLSSRPPPPAHLTSSADNSDSQHPLMDDTTVSVNLAINAIPDADSFRFTDEELDHQLNRMFTLEGVGLTEDQCQTDLEIVQKFDESIEKVDNKYFVEIPFFDNVDDVPTAYNQSLSNMRRVKRSLIKRGLHEDYSAVFHHMQSQGVIEKVTDDSENCVYIPHHAVVKYDERSTTKVRPVFNCSAKPVEGKPSLNEACFKGLDLLNDLVKLIIAFRTHKFTVTADIEKAFLQIYLKSDDDKNRFRFLWEEKDLIEVFRFNTLLFGLNCSPFILARVIIHHLNCYADDSVAQILEQHLYVDNLIYSTSDMSKLNDVYTRGRSIMANGGFNLRCWTSNNADLRQQMSEDGTCAQHGETLENLLGYQYDPSNDQISLADFTFTSKPSSKRTVLSDVSRVYDPLSLMCPVTISGRLLIQELWKRGVDWDDPLPDELLIEWNRIKENLQQLKAISIPRMAIDFDVDHPPTLHLFSDGSLKAYGFSCYVCADDKSGLVYAKAKIAPNKKSIPQLELLAAHLAFKSLPFLLECFPAQHIHVWVDAQVVLSWLETGYKTKNKFTVNRIREVVSMREEMVQRGLCIECHYVETASNPADFLTRGLSFREFQKNFASWMCGPEWLCNSASWPHVALVQKNVSQTQCYNSTVQSTTLKNRNSIIDIERFSSLSKMVRVINLVFKFVRRFRDFQREPMRVLIADMQAHCFKEERHYLKNQTGVVPKLVQDLNLFIDDEDIIRAKGRIDRVGMYNYGVLRPILLSKHHHLTNLIVLDMHEKCKHLGVGTTLSCVRQNGYWIPAGRQVVKSIIKDCMICRKMNAISFNYPKMTNLPEERVKLIKPFQHTAVDYTGPLHIFDASGNSNKVYVALYTCMAIRAVHLEVVNDLTSKSFIESFKRFCNAQTVPKSVYTDNAGYFTSGFNYLSNFASSYEFASHLQSLSIKHETIPAYASWVGGVYERQIRTLKQCLLKSIGRAKLTFSDLIMHISDVQMAINNRPITYLYSDIDEVVALTPNMILKIHSNPHLCLSQNNEDDHLWTPLSNVNVTHEQINETFQQQTKLFDEFKRMWYSSYLLSLRETSHDIFQSDWSNRMKVGDVVLISTKDQPRIHWHMGRVIRLIHGDDGKVRSAILKTPHKETAHYAINHLYPLEIKATHNGDRLADSRCCQPSDEASRRTSRQAAQRQRGLVKQLIKQGQL